MSPDAIRLMAEAALESKTLARGIKSVTTTLIEDIVFTERQGTVRLGVAEVRRSRVLDWEQSQHVDRVGF
ncbi:MAG: hypothetical protein ABSD58_01370 [Verrucomicrobiia bacterium]